MTQYKRDWQKDRAIIEKMKLGIYDHSGIHEAFRFYYLEAASEKARAEAAERQRDEAMLALERLGKIAEKAGKSERTDVWGQTIDFISEIVDENLKRIKTNSQINPDQTPVPDIKPGDTVNVVNEIQFPFLKNVKVDHIRLHSFGKYAALEFEGELYIIPYEHLEATTEAIL